MAAKRKSNKQIKKKPEGVRRQGAPKAKSITPRKPATSLQPHHRAIAALLNPGAHIKTPSGVGESGVTPLTSAPGSIVAQLHSSALGQSNVNTLFIIKPSMHTGNPAILMCKNDGTTVTFEKAYPRQELFSASDMDDEQSSYKLNSFHATIESTGSNLNRMGSYIYFNPTEVHQYDIIKAAYLSFATSATPASMNGLISAIKSSPIAKNCSVTKEPVLEIVASSKQCWTESGDENYLSQSRFGIASSIIGLPAINTNFIPTGTEIFICYDGVGGTGVNALTFSATMHAGVEQHCSAKPAFMTPALPSHPTAGQALHSVLSAMNSHNHDITDKTQPKTLVKNHVRSSGLAGLVDFAVKHKKAEEDIGLTALSLL